MEDYGFPPVFPDDTEAIEGATADNAAATTEVDLTKKPKKVSITIHLVWLTHRLTDGQVKSKVAAKGGNTKYQWNILKMLGMSDEEIKKYSLLFYA